MKYLIFILSILSIASLGQIPIDPLQAPTTARINAAITGHISSTDVANTYTGTLIGWISYPAAFDVKFLHANTGSATFNLNSLGAKSIKKFLGGSLVDVTSGDWSDNEVVRFQYNGTVLIKMGGNGTGSGTVSTVSVTTANGVSGSVANATTTPAISLTLGAITPSSVNGVTISGSSTPTLAVTGTTTVSGTNTGDQTSVTGNAGTATALQTARNINGVPFDGTANITVTAAAGTLTGSTLASGVTASSLTSFGNSPTFVTPNIGTPSAATLTNATGLPLSTGVTGTLPIANGGTGTTTPGLVAGTNVTITGTWPNQTINSSAGGSGWALTGTSTLTGASTIVGSSSNTLQFQFPSLGTTATDGAGIWIKNTTSATSGNQQVSPSLLFESNGFHTGGTSGSDALKLRQFILPVQQNTSLVSGIFKNQVKAGSGSYYDLLTIDLSTGKQIISGDIAYDNPPMIEFVRHQSSAEVGRGSVGFLGTTEMNLSVNMDYTMGSHRYYDSTKAAVWYYQSNSGIGGFGLQAVKAGYNNHQDIWINHGSAVPFKCDFIGNGSGDYVTGGSQLTLQKINFIDDNYSSPNGVLKLSSTQFSFTGMDNVAVPKLKVGTLGFSGTEIATYQATAANTFIITQNSDNNTNYNQIRYLKKKSSSFNIGAGTKVVEFDYNGGIGLSGARATSTVISTFSNIEYYWQTTNSAGSISDRMVLGQEGNLQITGGLSLGYVAKTANYTLTAADYLVNCTANSFTTTLPTAVGIAGRIYIIKNTGSGTITLATTSSQTIDGSSPGTLAAGPTIIKVMSDGANWITL